MAGRVATTLNKKRSIEQDDIFLILATVRNARHNFTPLPPTLTLLLLQIFDIAQTVVTERAVDAGLGRHIDKLDANQINSYYKVKVVLFKAEVLS